MSSLGFLPVSLRFEHWIEPINCFQLDNNLLFDKKVESVVAQIGSFI